MRQFLLAATAASGLVAAIAAPSFAQLPNQPVVTTNFGAGSATGNFPEPGTVVVRFRARLVIDDGIGSDTNTIQKGVNGQPNGTKQGNLYFAEYARLYPGFDGTAANGLQYGAALEIRQNNGNNLGLGAGSANNTLYWRREGGYLGTPTAGRLWFGETDGAIGRMLVGTYEAFDYQGGFNGDVSLNNSAATQLSFPFPDVSRFYTTSKIVYLSPKFAGFDFGATFEPNDSTGQAGAGVSTYISTPGAAPTRRNEFEAVGRYQGSFGPVAAAFELGYIGSGVVANSTALPTASKAKGLNVLDAGMTINMAGFSVGGHYLGGEINNNTNPILKGQRHAQDFILGASYTFGTVIVGVQYMNLLNGGTAVTGTNGVVSNGGNALHETGVVVGGTWDYAPGALVYVSSLYGQRHQSGIDLLNGGASRFNNSTIARSLQIGNVFNF